MRIEELRTHTICLLGLGTNHYGLANFLLKQGIPLVIRDRNPERRVKFERDFPQFKGLVSWEITDAILKGLERFTLIFRSPSIPVGSPELLKAAKKGVIIHSQTKLFFDLCPARIIGVTGTKGKGTTASLLHAFLDKGYPHGKVYLAGNIGLDPFDFYESLQKDDIVILELSSFQLQDLTKSPAIAIMLTVGTDHLDHHKDLAEYHAAKQNIISHQGEEDVAVINLHDPAMRRYVGATKALTYVYDRFVPRRQSAWADRQGDRETIFIQVSNELQHFDSSKRGLLGEHNLDNILPAVIVASLLKVPVQTLQHVLASFKGLPHRLSLVGTFTGIDFYDDSIATMPEAAEAALRTFSGRRVHLIAGGNDKGGDYGRLGEAIAGGCVTLSLLPGTATSKLRKAVERVRDGKVLVLDAAKDPLFPTVFSGIQPHLMEGDVVLLSPAATSFASFPDAKVRGEKFTEAVLRRYGAREDNI